MKERLTNKYYLLALSALLFQILIKYGVKIDLGTYQLVVDLVCYTLMGKGIHTTFEAPTEPQDKIENIKY